MERRTEVQEGTKERSEGDRYYNVSVTIVGVIDHQQRNGCDDGYGNLVSPADIKEVVQKTEHGRYEK
jgi:hypothetical protein